jgi:hypothetical protein
MISLTVAAAALTLLVGGVSLAARAPANNSNPLVVHLLSRATAIDNFVDTGPAGPSPGDVYVWTDRELLAHAPEDPIDTADGRCVLIDPAALKFDCSITNHIDEGQPLQAGDIMVAGTLALVEGTSTFAIIGGTGPYRIAEATSSSSSAPSKGRTM